jgi:hypothetical protein
VNWIATRATEEVRIAYGARVLGVSIPMADETIVDGLFSELMAGAKPYLTAAEIDEIQQLLDDAEYELALETFVHTFVEGGKSATEHVFSLITRLTVLLHVPLDETIGKIDRL